MEQLELFSTPPPKRLRAQRGAELVEFALVFPVLMMFVVAALSLLWVGFIKVAAAQTAKEAARYASVPVACSGSLGGPLVETTLPSVATTLPDGATPTSIDPADALKTIPTVPETVQQTIDQTTGSVPQPPGTALGPATSLPMKMASATRQVPPIGPATTLQTTLTTIQSTVTSLVPTTVTLPPTTTTSITLPPTTTTSITLPPTTLLPSTTTTTTKPANCSPNFRTYPKPSWDRFQKEINGRVPLFHVGTSDLDITYSYTDPNCKDANGAQSDLHSPPDNSVTRCPTPAPNDPPSNAKVDVTVTKDLPAPLRFFAGIFDSGTQIHAHAGGDTRGE
jgi:hypothetical protein